MKSFVRAVGAVMAAFFGVRGRKNANQDSATFRPQHVIIAGILVMVAFVGILLIVVNLIVA